MELEKLILRDAEGSWQKNQLRMLFSREIQYLMDQMQSPADNFTYNEFMIAVSLLPALQYTKIRIDKIDNPIELVKIHNSQIRNFIKILNALNHGS